MIWLTLLLHCTRHNKKVILSTSCESLGRAMSDRILHLKYVSIHFRLKFDLSEAYHHLYIKGYVTFKAMLVNSFAVPLDMKYNTKS